MDNVSIVWRKACVYLLGVTSLLGILVANPGYTKPLHMYPAFFVARAVSLYYQDPRIDRLFAPEYLSPKASDSMTCQQVLDWLSTVLPVQGRIDTLNNTHTQMPEFLLALVHISQKGHLSDMPRKSIQDLNAGDMQMLFADSQAFTVLDQNGLLYLLASYQQGWDVRALPLYDDAAVSRVGLTPGHLDTLARHGKLIQLGSFTYQIPSYAIRQLQDPMYADRFLDHLQWQRPDNYIAANRSQLKDVLTTGYIGVRSVLNPMLVSAEGRRLARENAHVVRYLHNESVIGEIADILNQSMETVRAAVNQITPSDIVAHRLNQSLGAAYLESPEILARVSESPLGQYLMRQLSVPAVRYSAIIPRHYKNSVISSFQRLAWPQQIFVLLVIGAMACAAYVLGVLLVRQLTYLWRMQLNALHHSETALAQFRKVTTLIRHIGPMRVVGGVLSLWGTGLLLMGTLIYLLLKKRRDD